VLLTGSYGDVKRLPKVFFLWLRTCLAFAGEQRRDKQEDCAQYSRIHGLSPEFSYQASGSDLANIKVFG
jgi:hypothetical protein